MLEILNLRPKTFGLDISDLSLKIVKLKKRGELYNLASFGEEKIKPGIIKEGEIKDEDKLAEIIKTGLRRVKGEKLKTKYVIASLPEEKSFLQVIQMPRMSKEDLKSAVIYEAENYIPLPIQEVYLDSEIISPVNNHSDKFNVLLVALPRKTVDSYLSSLKKAGLQPEALEIESLSVARALIKNKATTSPILLVDLGETRTNFAVFAGHTLRFTSSISVSAGNFTEIISKNLGLSLAEAERLKMKYGLEKRIAFKIKGKEFQKFLDGVSCRGVLQFKSKGKTEAPLFSAFYIDVDKKNQKLTVLTIVAPTGGRILSIISTEALNFLASI